MARDNFTKKTTDILAERVGFLCSNPECRTHTVGPNVRADKSTRIGEAAHITAAASNGPRFEPNLTPTQRSHIINGIWLCSNCSDLIDKDADNFPVALLNKWKADAEYEMLQKIKGVNTPKPTKQDTQAPFLEADLIWSGSQRLNRGYSDKNPVEIEDDGRRVYVIGAGVKPIIHWELTWRFSLVIYNNSSYPAFNVKITPVGEMNFTTLTNLPNVNNLPALENIDLEATYRRYIESVHTEADELLANKIPKDLNGLSFQIEYVDENQEAHCTLVKIEDQELKNYKEK